MGNNIQIPYSGHIPGGIHVGTDVVISGRTLHHTNRFSINLCMGPTYDQGCALHFNPRMDSNHVVRNSMQGGAWGAEETSGGMPFRKGMGFEIHMKVKPHGYHVTINHRHFCDFNHRLPKEMVQYIYIEGEVHINYIQFRGGSSFPTPAFPPSAPAYPPAPSFPAPPSVPAQCPPGPTGYPGYPSPAGAAPIYNPPVPYTTPIPGGLYVGKIIYVSGIVNHGASRFTVNLLCGPSDSYDIALHFDVRLRYNADTNQVIRTHKQNGSYGMEERDAMFFPFAMNANFEIMILVEPNCFKVAVNNQHFTQFNHRIFPFQRADHLNVNGDCRLTQVRFQ